ncbi:MAG: hypothetical protein OEZ13_11745 [Spirochaetia bacterium]|nr:hypothetical protein [Spirochaetia bacterium]
MKIENVRKFGKVLSLLVMTALLSVNCAADLAEDNDFAMPEVTTTTETTAATNSVTVALTLPAAAEGKNCKVNIYTPGVMGPPTIIATTGENCLCNATTTAICTLTDVTAGIYVISGFVDNDASGGYPYTTGDYIGYYGATPTPLDAPAMENAVVPATGAVVFSFDLGTQP